MTMRNMLLMVVLSAATSALLVPAAVAAGATITVSREGVMARTGEVITVPFSRISAVMPQARMFHLVVRDRRGNIVESQITNYEHDHTGAQYDELVFSYDFPAGEKSASFRLEEIAVPARPVEACVYARAVPERYDDMAWENDRIAHRMYSMALNSPGAGSERLRGSGVDIWGKRVAYPVIDRWYAKGHDQFHKDGEGEGLDLYSIGGSRGAGGTGIWDGAKLWTSDNFVSAQVLSNGPRRAAFVLSYAPWDAGSSGAVTERKHITVDCGQNFDAQQSNFEFSVESVVIGIGITEHPAVAGYPAPVLSRDPGGRWISSWEENKDGGLGIAVVIANDALPAGFAHEAADAKGNANNLILVKAGKGMPLRFFTGTGWTGSGQFKDRAAWEAYVRDFFARIQDPIAIKVTANP